MSEHLYYFSGHEFKGQALRPIALTLPFDLHRWIVDWQTVQRQMLRAVPDAFTRDEWAYLCGFVGGAELRTVFVQTFGVRAGESAGQAPRGVDIPRPTAPRAFARPRGPVAVWLPNNVSLLGPLTLVLVSLSGNPVRLKAASQAEDLTEAFLRFARQHAPAGPLADYLRERVRLVRFDRADPRNREMAAEAKVRIVFGSDEAVQAIDALPHPADSVGVAFSDRQSEAWIQPARAGDETLTTLIKVFAIYGQAGCTSPRRAVLLDGSAAEARSLRDRLLKLWPKVVRRDVPMHVASQNVMARQWAAAQGWDAELAPRNAAVLLTGEATLGPIEGHMALPVVAATRAEALLQLPTNIQTIGHALEDDLDERWLWLLAGTSVKRFVPLGRMHHFGPVWDGFAFWRGLFEEVEVGHDR